MKTRAWSSATHTGGSVAQPAPTFATYNVGSEPLAMEGPTHKLAFYNVGWQSTSKKHTASWLTREVSEIVTNGNVDAIGVSEVFNIRNELEDRREAIMSELLVHLNQGSAEKPAEKPA